MPPDKGLAGRNENCPTPTAVPATCPSVPDVLQSLSQAQSPLTQLHLIESALITEEAPVTHSFGIEFLYVGLPHSTMHFRAQARARTNVTHRPRPQASDAHPQLIVLGFWIFIYHNIGLVLQLEVSVKQSLYIPCVNYKIIEAGKTPVGPKFNSKQLLCR